MNRKSLQKCGILMNLICPLDFFSHNTYDISDVHVHVMEIHRNQICMKRTVSDKNVYFFMRFLHRKQELPALYHLPGTASAVNGNYETGMHGRKCRA